MSVNADNRVGSESPEGHRKKTQGLKGTTVQKQQQALQEKQKQRQLFESVSFE